MKYALIAVVFLYLTTPATSQQSEVRSTKQEIRLRAKMIAIVPLQEFSGQAFQVDIDPRFALKVKMISVEPLVADLRSGAIITFAIHSPSLVFGDDPKIGKNYDFSLCREMNDSKVKFSRLGVRFQQGGTIGGCDN